MHKKGQPLCRSNSGGSAGNDLRSNHLNRVPSALRWSPMTICGAFTQLRMSAAGKVRRSISHHASKLVWSASVR